MSHPYKYILDEVEIKYVATSRKYLVTFRKVVKNLGIEPLQCIYARLNVMAFPDDEQLSREYYRRNPLKLPSVGFFVRDASGAELAYRARHEDDSNTELDLLFKDAKTGELSPLDQNERREIMYGCEISDEQWGPYIQRHVRYPCDSLRVHLIFPDGLVRAWGEHTKASGIAGAFSPKIKEKKAGQQDEFIWNVRSPEVGATYRIRWHFTDGHYDQLKREVAQRLVGVKVSDSQHQIHMKHSSDFRTVIWDNTTYTFTNTQAGCVQVLWEAWESGVSEISQVHILSQAGSKSERLIDIFRTKGKKHPAWGVMIIQGQKKGLYRLSEPPSS